MSKKVITVFKWSHETKRFDVPVEIELARPDRYGRRGGPVCAVCGGKTSSVLDGEAWCERCKTYQ